MGVPLLLRVAIVFRLPSRYETLLFAHTLLLRYHGSSYYSCTTYAILYNRENEDLFRALPV